MMRAIRQVARAVAEKMSAHSGRHAAIDYEQVVALDAQVLAATGVRDAYERLWPRVAQYAHGRVVVGEVINSSATTYEVTAADERYHIYGPTTPPSQAWANAAQALIDIVNGQLAEAPVRLYALDAGPELSAVLLTPEQAAAARAGLPSPADWPYIPTRRGPHFGQAL